MTMTAMFMASAVSALVLRSAAVRTQPGILAGCNYKALAAAKVDRRWGAEAVEVSFCGRSAKLRKRGPVRDPFDGVEWWDASQQGEKLTGQESETLKNHVGSYWRYGRSVVQLGRGLLPPLYSEDYNTDFKDKDYVSLARSVLDFTVTLGDAANKLPAPKTCVDSWLSVWLPSEKLQALRAKAANGETTSFSWFQSPTTDEDHSYMFLSDNNQPSHCSPYCQWRSFSFPVQFHFRTRHSKDVAKYDDKEKPVLILPNLAFKVLDVSEVITDPLYVMSSAELVEWLNETHPYRNWQYERAGQSFGPYPRLAQAVQDRGMDGQGFSAWEVDGKYDMLHLEGAEYRPFFDALASRFEMPPRAGRFGTPVANQAPYIIKVKLEDTEGCA
ncbi:clpC [Symbiodinium sp. CCMP2592]|nr:clpC [Symbiodinium sp. CCMP2592]